MKTTSVLIVEDNRQTLGILQNTFDEANARYEICSSSTDAWNVLRTNPQITDVLIRMNAKDIQGCQLCQRIREVKAADQLPILMIVGEDQLEYAAQAIDAGANDVLIDPFEARELRMRMKIHVLSHRRRMDGAHPIAGKAADESESLQRSPDNADATQRASGLVIPKFDPVSMRFSYGATSEQLSAWQADESITKVALDQIMVCPCCEAVPTFRLGCGACGSAWAKREPLIHHYACAHIGAESDFREGGEFVCPKCRQADLIAGSDFEIVEGSYACSDCGAKNSEPQLIGHCLSCQHRFPAHEAIVKPLIGLQFHRVHEVVHTDSTRVNERSSMRESVGTR